MGLFDDFDVDMDEVKEAGGFDFEDGHYEFEISEALIQNGTTKDPDDTKFIIKYDLDEAGTYWEWFTVAVDGDTEAKKAKDSLSFLKGRLLDLGFKAAELNDISPEDLEGIVGTLELKTTNGKGKNAANRYQNVRNVKVASDDEPETEEADEPEEAPAESDAEIKKRVAANRAARQEKAEAPARRTVKKETAAPARGRRSSRASDEDENENPFG